MKNLETVFKFILGIIWMPCILVTFGAFSIFSAWLGDLISGYDSISTLDRACTGKYCILEATYKTYLANPNLFICMVIYGIIGLIYINRKKLNQK